MREIEAGFGPWVVRARWPILLVSLVIVGFCAAGMRHLHFTTDYRIFFSPENPERLAFEALENMFAKNDNVMIILAPRDGDVFSPDMLNLIRELTTRSWQTPYSTRVDSIANFQHTTAADDDLAVRDLIGSDGWWSDENLVEIRTVALSEPMLVNRLVSERGHVTGINITVQLPGINSTQEVPEVVEFVREMVQQIERTHPDVQVRLAGMVMMNNAFTEASKLDMATLVPVSFVLMLLTLAGLLRNLAGTLATLVVIAFSVVTALGVGGYLGVPISPPSASAPTIILTVALASSVHVLVTWLREMRRGRDRDDAVAETLRINLQPVFLAAMTTAIGFLTMNFSEVPPFKHLGNLVAMGVVASFVFSVTVLPALLCVLPIRVKAVSSHHVSRMRRLAEVVIHRRRVFLWGGGVVILGLVIFVPRNELNDVFVHYFDTSVTFRQDTDFMGEHLTGPMQIEYSLRSTDGGIATPAFLREVSLLTTWLREQSETRHVSTLTDVMKRLNRNMHGDRDSFYGLPETRDLAAQYLLLYEMSLPFGLDLNNQIDIDKSSIRLTVNNRTMSTNEVLAFDKRVLDWIDQNAPSIDTAGGTGGPMMFAHIGARNIVAMLVGTTIALILISFVLVAALRSLRIGLVSMVPNLAPAAMGFGLWGIFDGQIGLALSVVTTMTLGIVVDDTVHFLSKYLRARREEGASAPDAVRYAFETVGSALVVTTLVLVVGFLVLATSTFELNSGMGLLTAVVIALALVADFFFLPALLMWLDGRQTPDAERLPRPVTSRTLSDKLP